MTRVKESWGPGEWDDESEDAHSGRIVRAEMRAAERRGNPTATHKLAPLVCRCGNRDPRDFYGDREFGTAFCALCHEQVYPPPVPKTTTTDPVAREIIDAAQRAMDLLDEASIALDDALFTDLNRQRLTELSHVLRKALAVADSRVNALCVWAASKGER